MAYLLILLAPSSVAGGPGRCSLKVHSCGDESPELDGQAVQLGAR